MQRFLAVIFIFLFTVDFSGLVFADIVFSYVNYEKHFAGTTGSFVIHDIAKNLTVRNDETQSAKRFSPCGTFDIVTALAGLQQGAVKDQTALASAMSKTNDPYFQELQSKVGKEKIQSFLNNSGYGNKDFSSGIESLSISPNEQVLFLAKLYTNQLRLNPQTVEAVRGALVRSSRSGKIFSGHGGVCRSGDKNLAWFVGHLKTRDGEYVFATNMESGPEIKAERAEAVTRSILEEMNLL